MTFLELQHKIEQTRKARRGIANRQDYFEGEEDREEFYAAVYKRALSVANQIVRHYEDKGEFDAKDKPKLTWRTSGRES